MDLIFFNSFVGFGEGGYLEEYRDAPCMFGGHSFGNPTRNIPKLKQLILFKILHVFFKICTRGKINHAFNISSRNRQKGPAKNLSPMKATSRKPYVVVTSKVICNGSHSGRHHMSLMHPCCFLRWLAFSKTHKSTIQVGKLSSLKYTCAWKTDRQNLTSRHSWQYTCRQGSCLGWLYSSRQMEHVKNSSLKSAPPWAIFIWKEINYQLTINSSILICSN